MLPSAPHLTAPPITGTPTAITAVRAGAPPLHICAASPPGLVDGLTLTPPLPSSSGRPIRVLRTLLPVRGSSELRVREVEVCTFSEQERLVLRQLWDRRFPGREEAAMPAAENSEEEATAAASS